MRIVRLLLAAVVVCVVSGCEESTGAAAIPAAHELTRDDIGYYCNMIVVDHGGPKAQIFLSGRDQPLWFTSVRDAFAFTMLDEEPKNIVAIWVNDAAAITWAKPEPGHWIEARDAWFVVGSDARGGMGAPEVVPFASREMAAAFAQERGGTIFAFDAVPREAVLAPVASAATAPIAQEPHND